MSNWIWAFGSWHILIRVDKAGWVTKCGSIITWDASVVDEAPPQNERHCPRCLDLEKEPKP